MNRRDACHKLADLNEVVYNLKERLSDIRVGLGLLDKDDERYEKWCKEKEEIIIAIEEAEKEAKDFLYDNYDIIHPSP